MDQHSAWWKSTSEHFAVKDFSFHNFSLALQNRFDKLDFACNYIKNFLKDFFKRSFAELGVYLNDICLSNSERNEISLKIMKGIFEMQTHATAVKLAFDVTR